MAPHLDLVSKQPDLRVDWQTIVSVGWVAENNKYLLYLLRKGGLHSQSAFSRVGKCGGPSYDMVFLTCMGENPKGFRCFTFVLFFQCDDDMPDFTP